MKNIARKKKSFQQKLTEAIRAAFAKFKSLPPELSQHFPGFLAKIAAEEETPIRELLQQPLNIFKGCANKSGGGK